MDRVRKLGWVYFAGFIAVVILGAGRVRRKGERVERRSAGGDGEHGNPDQQLVDPRMRPSRTLVIGRKRSDFASPEEGKPEIARLLWFMPPHRALVLMPDDWRLEEMTRLEELFHKP